ncbi:hypothetical protein [Rummeliibacillus stabekisii]|nr:hypothetical protein [Rummeliibacillus stabekisii]
MYKESHIKVISLLAEKFDIDESMVEANSIEEYEAVPENYLEEE